MLPIFTILLFRLTHRPSMRSNGICPKTQLTISQNLFVKSDILAGRLHDKTLILRSAQHLSSLISNHTPHSAPMTLIGIRFQMLTIRIKKNNFLTLVFVVVFFSKQNQC